MKQETVPKIIKTFAQSLQKLNIFPKTGGFGKALSRLKKDLIINTFSSRHLDRSILLEETGSPAVLKLTIYCCFFFVITFIVWASLMKLDEVAIANGEILPLGKTYPMQHLDGGVVARIHVKDGDKVKKGQALIDLDVSKLESQLNESKTREKALSARIGRLEAFLKNRNPKNIESKSLNNEWKESQMSILIQSFKSLAASRKVIDAQTSQLEDELKEMEIRRIGISEQKEKLKAELVKFKSNGEKTFAALAKEKELMEEEIEIREELVDQGLNSNIKFLVLQRQFYQIEKEIVEKRELHNAKLLQYQQQLSELDIQIKSLPLEISKRQKRISELQSTLKEKESIILEKAYIELDEIKEQFSQAHENTVRLEDSIQKSHMRAPISGIVHGLEARAQGAVISAGDVVMQIVPEDIELMAEVHIANRDIGHVKSGLDVVLKITTYDFSRYGSLKATLEDISATSYYSDTEEPYYLGKITLDSSYLDEEGKYPLLPGMTLRAEIITGNKSVMEYILKPIYTSTKQALKER